MPILISIAVESPERYIAIDSDGRVWGGQAFTKPGGPIVIKWEPVTSEFPGKPVRKHGPQKKGRRANVTFALTEPPKKGDR